MPNRGGGMQVYQCRGGMNEAKVLYPKKVRNRLKMNPQNSNSLELNVT